MTPLLFGPSPFLSFFSFFFPPSLLLVVLFVFVGFLPGFVGLFAAGWGSPLLPCAPGGFLVSRLSSFKLCYVALSIPSLVVAGKWTPHGARGACGGRTGALRRVG
jgi:hypothetical protein